MISYQDFRRLWGGAQDCSSLDAYIAEEGGSVPLDDVYAVIWLLGEIYTMAQGDAKTIRDASGLTQRAMSREYGIPESTINKWDSRIAAPPKWAHILLAYAIISDAAEEERWKN